MQIRKRGTNFQLLRRFKVKNEDSYAYKMLGAFPVICRSITDIDPILIEKLTKREQGQLEEYLEKRLEKLNDTLKKRELELVPKMLSEVSKLINSNFRENYDIDEILAAYKRLTRALCEHGYGPELVEITLSAAAKPISEFELEEDDADTMMLAWNKVKKSMDEHGYTTRWHSAYKKNK